MPSDESAAILSTARQQLEMSVAVDGDFSDGDALLVMALHRCFTARVNTAGAGGGGCCLVLPAPGFSPWDVLL
jgi:hypothetical protein